MACDAQSATAESARAELRAARQDIDNLQAALAEMEAQRSSVRGHALDKCTVHGDYSTYLLCADNIRI